MKQRSQKSMELYRILKRKQYQDSVCELICDNLNTDYTAERMIRYLYCFDSPRLEDLADEMFAILNERNQIVEKHKYFHTNGEWNYYLNNGMETEDT